jgi:hypothetical protein
MKLYSKTQGMRTNVVRVLCILFLLFTSLICAAQTVRPIISEYTGTGKGRVELVNDSTIPLTVIVSPKGFEVSDTGELNYGPMPDDIHLKLSAMSFRVQPKQSYYVFYEARSDCHAGSCCTSNSAGSQQRIIPG